MEKELVLSDYKKWLLYTFGRENFESHYNLFKALLTRNSFGTVKITTSEIQGQKVYIASANGISEDLHVTEEQRAKLLEYLIQNYFQTSEPDALMIENKRQAEVSMNHNFLGTDTRDYADAGKPVVVRPHPKETLYFNIKLVISILVYLVLGGLLIYSVLTNLSVLLSLVIMLPLVGAVVLLNKMAAGIFIGMIRGRSIRVTREQFPDLFNVIAEQAKKLQVEIPEIYITSGDFNAFVTRFSRGHVLMIYSEVLETTLQGNYDVLKYVTAHELCHIKQRHLAKRKWLFPSAFIPFLSLAYSRGCEYTCDRIGYHFSPKGAIQGILIMTTGKEIYSKFNVEVHIKNALETDGLWTWLSEKFLTHPHLYKRLIEIKKFSTEA